MMLQGRGLWWKDSNIFNNKFIKPHRKILENNPDECQLNTYTFVIQVEL